MALDVEHIVDGTVTVSHWLGTDGPLGLTSLAAFMWSLRSRQYDDMEGARSACAVG